MKHRILDLAHLSADLKISTVVAMVGKPNQMTYAQKPRTGRLCMRSQNCSTLMNEAARDT